MAEIRARNGVVMATGALMRPHDPRDAPYRLTRTLPIRAIDWSQPVSLARYARPVRDQGGMGSCAAVSSGVAAEMAYEIATDVRAQAQDLNYTWLYWHARRRRGWQGQDTGSYPEDNLDLLRDGAPGLTGQWPHQYVPDPTWVPPPEVEGAPRFDYVLSYRPFAPQDGLEALWTALAAKMPVVVAMAWPSAFFRPEGLGGCWLPRGVVHTPQDGGHALIIRDLFAGGYATVVNSWSPRWTPDAAQAGRDIRPGECVIPPEYLTPGPLCKVWGFYAVSFEPVSPPPDPDPSCRDKALAIADAQVAQADRALRAKPKSYDLRGRWRGAAALRDALATGL